jgi:hypothetical protein
MTHEDLLELSTDGTISNADRARARALDAAERREFVAPPLPPREPASRIVERMAEVMLSRMAADGACGETDLLAAGFSRADMLEFGERAQGRAARLSADRRIGRRA